MRKHKYKPTNQWHSLNEQEVLKKTDTSMEAGLLFDEVQKRQETYGLNVVKVNKDKNPFIVFMAQFHQALVYILIISAVVTFLLQEYVESIVITAVVLLNAIIGFAQEVKAIKAIHALKKIVSSEATVLREGKKHRVLSSELTIGDIVYLKSGDKVPADLRLIYSKSLQIDESTLTGESVAVQKKNIVLPEDEVLGDRFNMAYASTLVTYGVGTGIVVEIGDATEIGRINQLVQSAQDLQTPLTIQMNRFSNLLLYVILGLSVLTFLIGFLQGENASAMFMAVVAMAVGAIPEGLPAALTITLAIGVNRMAKRNAIIRKLPAVETLGSTAIICTDKTGTLTKNQMTVQEIFDGENHYLVTGSGYLPEGNFEKDGKVITDVYSEHALHECLLAGLLCNDSKLVCKNDLYKIEGDPTEGALLVSALKSGLNIDAIEEKYPRFDSIPFESHLQYMATAHKIEDKSHSVIYMKGSLESVLERCEIDFHENKINKELLIQQANQMALKGLRVLSFAKKIVQNEIAQIDESDVKDGFTFLGLQAMMDPPRPEAIKAVKACKSAGIHVKVISGDHELTVVSIAKQMGIINDTNEHAKYPLVLNGKTLKNMSDDELKEVALHVSVFARISPEDKLRLVEAYQSHNLIIAMTGDGVNDAPALKQANIGVAMGITGTDVAKETSDVILTDDNFASIEEAVKEGRCTYDNIIKFITWTLPTNIGEGLIIICAVVFGLMKTLPISPVQILWINTTTAVLLGLMLAFEDKEPNIMKRPPRKSNKPVLSSHIIFRTIMVGGLLCVSSFILFEYAMKETNNVHVAQTMAVNLFIFGELFYLFSCRSLYFTLNKIKVFSNPFLLLGCSLMIFCQVIFVNSSQMNLLFGTAYLSLQQWLLCIALGFIVLLITETEKWICNRYIYNRKAI